MEFLRIDLFQDEIFVFTPMGDVKQLPKGATPIDFAFAVHTQVGLRCNGAKINGKIVPLSRELKNGDTVEVLTDQKQRPSRDWLAFVKTARARNKIRQWIKEEEFGSSVRLGREFIEREIRKSRREKVGRRPLRRGGEEAGVRRLEHLFAALGPRRPGPQRRHPRAVAGDGGGRASARALAVRAAGVARARRGAGARARGSRSRGSTT
jgi:GTP pyrophosphokinase